MKKELTPIAEKMLAILYCEADPIMAREVAQKAWPDARGWDVVSNCGNRHTGRRGGQMGGAAGRFLWRLQRAGYVAVSDRERDRNPKLRYVPHFAITSTGRAALERARSSR